MRAKLAIGIICVIVGYHLPSIHHALVKKLRGAEKPKEISAPSYNTESVEEYAKRLRKDFDSLRIYQSSNRFEIWTKNVGETKWKEVGSLEEARKVVDDYYLLWAKNCIGDKPQGKRVE